LKVILRGKGDLYRIKFSEEYQKIIKEYDGLDVVVTIEEAEAIGAKQQMYNYLCGVLYPSAVKAFRYFGFEYVDAAYVDHKFKCMFAVGTVTNSKGVEENYPKDKSKMKKDELHRFITDCILFLEKEMDWKVPDSSQYKMYQQTGRNFKKV